MALTKEEEKNIERCFDAAKAICKTLAPLSVRAQRRIIIYFQDLVTDPEQNAGPAEVEVLKRVEEALGFRR